MKKESVKIYPLAKDILHGQLSCFALQRAKMERRAQIGLFEPAWTKANSGYMSFSICYLITQNSAN